MGQREYRRYRVAWQLGGGGRGRREAGEEHAWVSESPVSSSTVGVSSTRADGGLCLQLQPRAQAMQSRSTMTCSE